VSRTDRPRSTRVALVVGAMIGALALAGCGAGQIAQTADQTAAVSGSSVTVGDIAVRNAEIEFPIGAQQGGTVYQAGGTAPVSMTVANVSDVADRLVSASSPVAGAVTILGDTALPGQHILAVGTPKGTPVLPNANEVQLALTGLNQGIAPGLTYPLVLTFERAGTVTVELPVGYAETPRKVEAAEGGH
jgi:copper(I)-binding protein